MLSSKHLQNETQWENYPNLHT